MSDGGEQADVGGVADPGDGIDLLLARPLDQLGEVAAGVSMRRAR